MNTIWSPSASASRFFVLNLDSALQEYLLDLLRAFKYLAVGNVDKDEVCEDRTRLDDVWQCPRVSGVSAVLGAINVHDDEHGSVHSEALRLRSVFGAGAGGAMNAALSDAVDLDLVLDSGVLHHCVITSNPGHGKSTLMRRIAQRCCDLALSNTRSLVPIVVPLRSVTSQDCSDAHSLLRFACRTVNHDRIANDMFRLEASGHLWWLIDGLDEVRDPSVRRLCLGLLDDLRYSASRVWVSCRKRDFDILSADELSWPTLNIEPFTDDQIDRYVADWHRKTPFRSNELRSQRLQATNSLIKGSPIVRDMSKTPLLLALICSISASLDSEHRRVGRKGKAQFLRKAAEAMLAFRESAFKPDRYSLQSSGTNTGTVLAIVQALALHTLGTKASGIKRQISAEELEGFIRCESLKDWGVDGAESKRMIAPVVSKMFDRMTGATATGLLHEVQLGVYEFIHDTFREYCAAMCLLESGPVTLRDHLLDRDDCYEVMRFAAAESRVNTYYVPPVLHLVAALARRSMEADLRQQQAVVRAATDAGLAAELLAEIGRPALAASEPTCIAPSTPSDTWRQGSGSFAGLLPDLAEWCWKCARNPMLTVRQRVSCATACSRIGDPRFVDQRGEIKADRRIYVSVRGGHGRVGQSTPLSTAEPKATRLTMTPEIAVSIGPLRVRTFPVTNLEYAQFVEDGGYDTERFWKSGMANQWRVMDSKWLGTLVKHCISQAKDNLHKELAEDGLRFTKEGVIAEAMMFRGTNVFSPPKPLRPLFWDDSRFNVPSSPVVGVNWWEAMAFCAWESEKLRASGSIRADQSVTLPSEAEWEWLASRQYRGERLAYPWGNELDDSRCAIRDFDELFPKIVYYGAPPVGSFDLLIGDPSEPCDLAGGVWEWVSSPKAAWDKPVLEAEISDPLHERIVRGGSWFSNEPNCVHTSFRLYDPPCNAYWDLGFRTVVRE